MLELVETRFVISAAPSTKNFSPEASELVLFPLSKKVAGARELSSDAARWTPDAVAQFTRKRKELDEQLSGDIENALSPDEPAALRIHFNSGGTSLFLGIDSRQSTFEINTALRKCGEELIQAARGSKPALSLRLDLRHLDDADARRVLPSFAFLCNASTWKPRQFGKKAKASSGKKTASEALTVEVLTRLNKAEAQALALRGAALGNANNRVRTLADLPANELNPKSYRQKAVELCKELGLETEFLDYAELEKRKAGAFLAVARADRTNGAGILHVTYKPSKAGKNKKKLALIGKGICFDTGGYNIKTSHMLGMHGDMTGSAIALSMIAMYAELKVDFEIHTYLALAENLISPTAYKPNEVVVACDGTAIEVVDTDAEGRMVLSDTLAIARKEKPSLAIDFATLTGAAIRSLDTRRGAVFTNQPELAARAIACGDRTGERVWNFPIGDDYRRELKSKIADILQCSASNNADHIYAATFLSHFIGAETPWLHLDLVPAENKGGLGLVSSDTTGFGVFWADEMIREFFTSSS